MSDGQVVIDITADDKEFRSALGGLGKVAAVGAAAVAAAFAVVGAGVMKGVNDFIAFEQQMNEVFTLLPGISQQAMDEMTGQVKDFSREFGTLPDKVVPALYQAISAGVPKDNVFDFLGTAQKAAIGGVTELETAVDGISSVVNAYGSDVIGAAQASDLMFTAVKGGKTDFSQLSASLFQVIPTAAALGVQFGDVTAAIAAMTSQGTPTAVATTQIRQALGELSKSGGATADIFEKVAGKSFQQFIAEGGNLQGALGLMEKHAGDTGVSIKDLFGSVEAGGAALALTGKGTEKFAAELEAAGSSAGATDAAFETMEQGIGRSLDKLKAAVAVAFLEVGDAAAPAVRKIAEWLEGIDFAAVIAPLKAFGSTLAQTGNIFRDLAAIVGPWAAEFYEGTIRPALDGARQAFGKLAAEVIPTVKAIVDFIVQNWPHIKKVVEPLIKGVVQFVSGALQTLAGVIRLVMAVIRGDWSAAWDAIKGIATGVVNMLKGLFNASTLVLAGRQLVDGLRAGITNAWRSLISKFKGLINLLPAAVKKILGISSPSRVFAKLGEQIGEGWAKGLEKSGKQVVGAVRSTVSDLISAADSPVLRSALEFTPTVAPAASWRPHAGVPAFAAAGGGGGSVVTDNSMVIEFNQPVQRYSDVVRAMRDVRRAAAVR